MQEVWYFSVTVTESARAPRVQHRYLRTPVPIHFPSEESMPETAVHLRLRTALFLVLEGRLHGRAFIGSDQFVYWDPTDPRACVAPDAFVRLGGPLTLPPSFKVWEHGAPQLAIEVISRSDARDANQQEKLERYRRCGVAELAFFDPEDDERPLRLWDLVEGDLVERDLEVPGATFTRTLSAYLRVQPDAELGRALRISDDADGTKVWLTPMERVAELEAELARRG
jgi:Uma2 family endonuclease